MLLSRLPVLRAARIREKERLDRIAMSAWIGDLDDDCWLSRYGMNAHVEKMDRNIWWFSVGRTEMVGQWAKHVELYNSANMQTSIRLLTGKQARAAAEHVMELLAQLGLNRASGPEARAKETSGAGSELTVTEREDLK
jgi:hypothetical protein